MRAAKAAKDQQEGVDLAALDWLKECGEGHGCGVEYLKNEVFPLLRDLTAALCGEKPKNPQAFALLWLATKLIVPEPLVKSLESFLKETGDDLGIPLPDGSPPPLRPNRRGSAKQVNVVSPEPPVGPVVVKRASLDISVKEEDSTTTVPGLGETDAATTNAAEANTVAAEDQTKLTSPRLRSSPSQGDLERERRGSGGSLAGDGRARRSGRKPTALARRQASSFCLAMGQTVIPGPSEIVTMLRGVPDLLKYSDEEISKIADIVVIRNFDHDELIINSGQVCTEFHVIVSGVGKVCIPQPIGQLEKGDFAGHEALENAGPGTSPTQVSATAGGVVTLSIPRQALDDLQLKKECGWNLARKLKVQSRTMQRLRSTKFGHCETTGFRLVMDYTKTAHDQEMITQAVKNNRVLGEVMELDEDQCAMMVETMHLVEVPEGQEVFKAGDKGTAFFVVQEGLLKVQVHHANVQLRHGDTFGELALMYDEPRSATVEALVNCKLFVLPASGFEAVSSISAKRRLKEYSDMLSKIPSLASRLERNLFDMLAGVLDENIFLDGDIVSKEGEDEGILFLVYQGSCTYTDGDGETVILHRGDWIGEEQVINKTKATRTVTASSQSVCVLMLTASSLQLVFDACQQLTKDEDRKSVIVPRSTITRKSHPAMGQEALPCMERCKVSGALGEGSFGLVLLLSDQATSNKYALKGLNKAQLQKSNQEKMAEHERRVMLLFDSDFIVRLYGVYQDQNFIYLLLEPVFGGELYDVYTQQHLFGLEDHALFYIASVSLGLTHMHEHQVVWRDLKLENCLITTEGYLKLTDMGIAKRVAGKTFTVCGTADYFAPEVLRQRGHNRAADWWACGVLLFIMLSGRSPFDASDVTQIYKNIIKGMPKANFPKDLRADAKEVILALCRKNPQERVTMQKGGLSNLQEMHFFSAFSWKELQARTLVAPYIPPPPDFEQIAQKKLSQEVVIDWDELEAVEEAEEGLELQLDAGKNVSLMQSDVPEQ